MVVEIARPCDRFPVLVNIVPRDGTGKQSMSTERATDAGPEGAKRFRRRRNPAAVANGFPRSGNLVRIDARSERETAASQTAFVRPLISL